VWRASLRCRADVLERHEATLAPEEKKRAARFLAPRAKEDFIAARGILRELLGRYLGESAPGIQLRYGARGKPALFKPLPLRFNVSHSHGVAAFAFTRGMEVGIDIEKIRLDFAGEQVASLYFAEQEITELGGLPGESRAEGFFKCWTRKEAYLKARGEGLQIPLRSFQVTVTNDEPQELIDEAGSRWSLYGFEPWPGFAGAVVGEGQGWKLRHWEWRESGAEPPCGTSVQSAASRQEAPQQESYEEIARNPDNANDRPARSTVQSEHR
jgi:4'-phosphopantetheinyl transferase